MCLCNIHTHSAVVHRKMEIQLNLNCELIKIVCQYFLSLVFFVGFDTACWRWCICCSARACVSVIVLKHPASSTPVPQPAHHLPNRISYVNEVIPFGCEFSIMHIVFAYNGQRHTLSQRNYIKFGKHGSRSSVVFTPSRIRMYLHGRF